MVCAQPLGRSSGAKVVPAHGRVGQSKPMLSVVLTRPDGEDGSGAPIDGGHPRDLGDETERMLGLPQHPQSAGPVWGDTITQAWEKMADSAWWLLWAFGAGGAVYIVMALFETNWRAALDSFVTAASLWLLAIFVLRFRRAVAKLVLADEEDGEWVAGMVRTMKELSDIFEVLKMLSVLYLLRYGLLLMLFLVGLLGFFEKDPSAL